MASTNQAISKNIINFILSGFLLIDPSCNGLTKCDLDHYFLNKILFSNFKTNDSNILNNLQNSIQELETFHVSLNILVKKKYINFKKEKYYINNKHPECESYTKMYLQIVCTLHDICNSDKEYNEESIEQEDEDEEYVTESLKEFKYLVKSSADPKVFYKVTEDFSECNCKAFEYSKSHPKTCKHIVYCKETDKSKLSLINNELVKSESILKYAIKSSTDPNVFYKVTEDFSECNCKAFEYSKSVPKTCKHIVYCKEIGKDKLNTVFLNPIF